MKAFLNWLVCAESLKFVNEAYLPYSLTKYFAGKKFQ